MLSVSYKQRAHTLYNWRNAQSTVARRLVSRWTRGAYKGLDPSKVGSKAPGRKCTGVERPRIGTNSHESGPRHPYRVICWRAKPSASFRSQAQFDWQGGEVKLAGSLGLMLISPFLVGQGRRRNHQTAPPSTARPIKPKSNRIITWPTFMATNGAMMPPNTVATFKTGESSLIILKRDLPFFRTAQRPGEANDGGDDAANEHPDCFVGG